MHLSKTISASNAEASSKVLEYTPRKIEMGVNSQAAQFMQKGPKPNDFKMSNVIKVQTGIEKLEIQNFEQDVEVKVLEKLKEIQENAYQEAYNLGLEEGKKAAFEDRAQVLEEKVQELSAFINSVDHLKTELIKNNEIHIIKLIYEFSKRLAYKESTADNETLSNLIKESAVLAESEEKISLLVAPSQLQFLEELQKEGKREYDFLQKAKLIASEEVTPGGCIIQTNYTEVDARTETRVQKLWEELSHQLFKVKDQVST